MEIGKKARISTAAVPVVTIAKIPTTGPVTVRTELTKI